MNWKASPPALETVAAWTAALCLGGAVGFAVARIAPLGAGLAEASGAGALVALVAGLLVARVDRQRGSRRAPGMAGPSDELPGVDGVLLLDNRVDDEVLLLDDPLPALGDESRVVRLFAAPSANTAPATPLAGPGEMIARIEDFLGTARGSAARAEPPRRVDAAAEDASAALHAALADIRRSLKKG